MCESVQGEVVSYNMAASPVSCVGRCGLLVEPGPGAKESEEGVCVCVCVWVCGGVCVGGGGGGVDGESIWT